MSAIMQCEPCGKQFTGPVCFKQHIDSEKHKRKVLSLGLLNNSNVEQSSSVSQTSQLMSYIFDCSVCGVGFNSAADFQTHSLSSEHAVKVMKKNFKNDVSSEIISSSVDETDKILPDMDFQTSSFTTCDICNKKFSGPEPYKQHMESVLHKKKAPELESSTSATKTNHCIAPYSCDPCKKIFSGQVPYIQHMNSEIHKKKIQSLQFIEKPAFKVDCISETKVLKTENNMKEKDQHILWFCEICQVQCSGDVPYKQHLSGITHLKNMTKAQRERNSFQSENNIKLLQQEKLKNEGKYILNGSHTVNGISDQLNQINSPINNFVLPGMIDNLNIVSTEELEASIKIFLPDEDIEFEDSDNKMNVGSENSKNCSPINEVEIEINEKSTINQDCDQNSVDDMKFDAIGKISDEFQVCSVCNIKLLNKEEAVKHLASLEHFSMKWK